MHRTRPITALVALAGLVVAGCGSTGPVSSAAAGEPTSTPRPSVSAAASSLAINAATSPTLGTYLVGPNGMALYTHAGDGAMRSTCTGACEEAWPPLIAAAGQMTSPGPGVTGTFATLSRDDGSTQVTYNGKPLYYWTEDKSPGDVTGNGVEGFSVAVTAGAPVSSGAPAGSPGPDGSSPGAFGSPGPGASAASSY